MFREMISALPAGVGPYAPCPPASNRAAWEALPAEVRAQHLACGEKRRRFSWGVLSASDYMSYRRSGLRQPYELIYAARRSALRDLVLAECCEYKGRFLPDIADGLFAICGEIGWQLPAGNRTGRTTPPLPLPDASRPLIDPAAAETGALLAMSYYLLQGPLDTLFLGACILQNLNARLVQPYLSGRFWWMSELQPDTLDWTARCTAAALLCIFLTPQDEATRRAALRQAAETLERFAAYYPENGGLPGDPLGGALAARAFFSAVEVIRAAAPEAAAELYRSPKLCAMAESLVQLHAGEDAYFNFGSHSPHASHPGGREYLLGKRLGSEPLRGLGAQGLAESLSQPAKERAESLYELALEAFAAGEMLRYTPPSQPIPDVFWPEAGLLLARDIHLALAVKGGANADHCDAGSFILYKNGRPFCIDLGVAEEAAFSSESDWHNLPSLEGAGQGPGASFAASAVRPELAPSQCRLSMELSGCWPVGTVEHYQRTVRLQKGVGVQLVDETDYPGVVTMHLLTAEQPLQLGGSLSVGKLGHITASTEDIAVEALTLTDPALLAAWPETVYRIQLRFIGKLELNLR